MELREPTEVLDRRMVKVWRIQALISGAILPVAAVLAVLACWRWGWPWWIPVGLGLLGVLELWLTVGLVPSVYWKTWRYEVDERQIGLRYGLITVTRSLIPMVRIQHVDLKQGPIMRHYGVATITFSTAAGVHEIPGLSMEKAEAVHNQIVELARLAHEDI